MLVVTVLLVRVKYTFEGNFVMQYILHYPCADYQMCGLSMHDRKLLLTMTKVGSNVI